MPQLFKKANYGKITISIEDELIYEVDILAKNSIRKKNVKDYMIELLLSMGTEIFDNMSLFQ